MKENSSSFNPRPSRIPEEVTQNNIIRDDSYINNDDGLSAGGFVTLKVEESVHENFKTKTLTILSDFEREMTLLKPSKTTKANLIENMSAGNPKRSKNSIFEIDFSIAKPICLMSQVEVDAYKSSIISDYTLDSSSSDSLITASTPQKPTVLKRQDSIMVPVKLSYTQPTTLDTPPPLSNPTPPLLKDAQRPSFLHHDILPLLPTTTLNINPSLSPFKNPNHYLTHLPLQKHLLGTGQYSSVYKATFNGHSCAVKQSGGEGVTLAIQESRILFYTGVCGVAGVVRLLDIQTDSQSVYPQIMAGSSPEYCANADLDSWGSKNPHSVSLRLFLKWARQIGAAIGAIHSMGIVHHDIKPHNIMITDVLDVRLGDFGSAKFVPVVEKFLAENDTVSWAFQDQESVVDSSTIPSLPLFEPARSGSQSPSMHCLPCSDALGRGTTAYSAPEVLLFKQNDTYSFPIDMYSYGMTLFTLITGGREPYASAKTAVQIYHLKSQPFVNVQGCIPGWRHSDPSEYQWQFPDGSAVPVEICRLVEALVEKVGERRPSAGEVCRGILDRIESLYL